MYVILLAILMAPTALSQEFRLLDLNEFSMEGWRIEDQRDGYTQYAKPGTDAKEAWKGGAAANFNLNLIGFGQGSSNYSMYWDNRVFMNGTEKQVRHTGWQWETGLSFWNKLDIFWYHKSQHVLEEVYENEKFPLENRYGFRIKVFGRDSR